ncbi:MAG TPA: hypothetical protein VFX70_18585 [Mycobacteriales bacterium]|nr:hypothetical protein [Mycobacteriales bacterium]
MANTARARGAVPDGNAGAFAQRKRPKRCAVAECRPAAGQSWPRVAAADSAVCPSCLDRVRADLSSLPELYEACAQVLAHPWHGLTERISGGGGAGIPLNEAAVTARLDMLTVLTSWSALVVRERGVRAPERREVPDLTAFLARHLDALAAHPAASDFVAEVGELVGIGRATAYPSDVHRVELGQCMRPGCGQTVHAILGTEHSPARVECEDGHDWPPERWLLLRSGQRSSATTGGAR